MVTAEAARQALADLRDAGSGRSLLELGWLANLRLQGDRALVDLALPGFAASQRDAIVASVRERLVRLEGIASVQFELRDPPATAAGPSAGPALQAIPGVGTVIAVSSGKGGVGKSTVAVNLACALAAEGLRVGLLDADIYGPNAPLMLGVADRTPAVSGSGDGQRLEPIETCGLAMVSMGLLIGPDQPVIWRGPMLNGIIRQFLYQVEWGERDVLVVDLPPGTGDAQLSLAQAVPMAGVVIVTTPQQVALQDARRGLAMFRQMGIPILGVVENMSWFSPPDRPDRRYAIFGSDGGQTLANEAGVPLLARIPIELPVQEGGDRGQPVTLAQPDSAAAVAFREAARSLRPVPAGQPV